VHGTTDLAHFRTTSGWLRAAVRPCVESLLQQSAVLAVTLLCIPSIADRRGSAASIRPTGLGANLLAAP
jgi:hypothetical protein